MGKMSQHSRVKIGGTDGETASGQEPGKSCVPMHEELENSGTWLASRSGE